jgi:pyruvate/2-oxoglutarate dehydrogenase complex dihydrolipoamide acyltransferase (E2) component
MTDITVPEGLWSEADKTGSIVVWLYQDGARVNRGDVIAELMVEKVTFEIEAPASGALRIAVEPEVPVEMGARLGGIFREE